jgi:hypothetical protein
VSTKGENDAKTTNRVDSRYVEADFDQALDEALELPLRDLEDAVDGFIDLLERAVRLAA